MLCARLLLALMFLSLRPVSHVFMHCRVSGAAGAGVAQGAVDPAGACRAALCQLDTRVLLAGDHTVWSPGGGMMGRVEFRHCVLIDLRLLFCRALWAGTCGAAGRLSDGQQVFTVGAVVALMAAWVERAVRRLD